MVITITTLMHFASQGEEKSCIQTSTVTLISYNIKISVFIIFITCNFCGIISVM